MFDGFDTLQHPRIHFSVDLIVFVCENLLIGHGGSEKNIAPKISANIRAIVKNLGMMP